MAAAIHYPAFQLGNQRATDLPGFVLVKLLYGGLVNARVIAKLGNGFLLAVVGLQHAGPLRPGVVCGTLGRGAGHHFQLHHALATLADSRAHAVVTGVAAANDQHLFACGRNRLTIRKVGIQQTAGHAGQVIHGEVDALCIAAGGGDVTGLLGTAAQHYGVILVLQFLSTDIAAHIGVHHKLNAFILQDLHAAVDDPLFQLHVGDAVHQQAARAVLALINSHLVAALVQQVGHRKPRRACTNDRNRLAGAGRRRHGVDSAALVAVFYDGAFVLFHGHRVAGGHAAGAGGLAQSGADPAGKLRVAVGSD